MTMTMSLALHEAPNARAACERGAAPRMMCTGSQTYQAPKLECGYYYDVEDMVLLCDHVPFQLFLMAKGEHEDSRFELTESLD